MSTAVVFAEVAVWPVCLPTRPSLALIDVAAWSSGGDLLIGCE